MKAKILTILLLATLSFSQFISGRNYDLTTEEDPNKKSFGASLQGYTSMVDWENSVSNIDTVLRRDNELKYDALKFGISLHYKQRIDDFEYMVKYNLASYVKSVSARSENITPDSLLANDDFEETLITNKLTLKSIFNNNGFGGDIDVELLSHDNDQADNSGFIIGFSPSYTFENSEYKYSLGLRYNYANDDAKDILSFSRSYFLRDVASLGFDGTKKFNTFNLSLLLNYHHLDEDMFENNWYLESLASVGFEFSEGMSFKGGIGFNTNFTDNILDIPIPTYSYQFNVENRVIKNTTFGLRFKFEGKDMAISEDAVSATYLPYTNKDIKSSQKKSSFVLYLNYDF